MECPVPVTHLHFRIQKEITATVPNISTAIQKYTPTWKRVIIQILIKGTFLSSIRVTGKIQE